MLCRGTVSQWSLRQNTIAFYICFPVSDRRVGVYLKSMSQVYCCRSPAWKGLLSRKGRASMLPRIRSQITEEPRSIVLCYRCWCLRGAGWFDPFRQAAKTAEIVPNKYTERSQQMVTTYTLKLFPFLSLAFLSRTITAPSALPLKAFYNFPQWTNCFNLRLSYKTFSSEVPGWSSSCASCLTSYCPAKADVQNRSSMHSLFT